MRRPLRTTLLSLGTILLLAGCTGSGPPTPTVADAWVRSNPNGMGAAYLTITMPDTDRLIAAEVSPSIAGRVEVHEVVDDEGRMLMREVVGGIPLPAGQAVELRPGGFHLMLLGMPATLEVGTTIEVTLLFAESPSLTVTAEVREGTTAMDGDMDDTMHSGMHDGNHGDMHSGMHGG
jgi:copper(I)-binding protein